MSRNTVFADQDILFFKFRTKNRRQVLIMKPIFTLIALDHELIDVFERVGFLTVAIRIEVVLIVIVFLILIILFLIVKLAS